MFRFDFDGKRNLDNAKKHGARSDTRSEVFANGIKTSVILTNEDKQQGKFGR